MKVLFLLGVCLTLAHAKFTITVPDDFENTIPEDEVKPKFGGLFRKHVNKEDLNVHPDDKDDTGDPLFLTPLLKQNKIKVRY